MGRPPKATREQVLAAAREQFASRGFEATTLADIAGQVGLSPAALLRHAPTKQALFESAMRTAGPDHHLLLPVDFLDELSGAEDPEPVMRRLAEAVVPALEERIGATIALWMRSQSGDPNAPPLLFDPNVRPTPPQRVARIVSAWMVRATQHGRLKIDDPLAATLGFMGALQAYVWFHKVMRALDPPLPLPRYVDHLVALYCPPRRSRRPVAAVAGKRRTRSTR